MFKIESDTRRLKHDVLTRVAELAYQGKLNSETIDEIPFEIIPGRQPHFRCCVYKERAILSERVKLAMGGDRSNPNVIEVLDIAAGKPV